MNEGAPQLPLELDASGEVVLHATPELAAELRPLMQSLLAEGFDARVITDAKAFEAAVREAETPVVHVVCRRGDELDLDRLRARARELSDVDHVWLDGSLAADKPLRLLGSITRTATDLGCPEPGAVIERVDVDEVSNVVLLPTPKAVVPKKRKIGWRFHAAAMSCGGLAAAFAFAVLSPAEETPAPVAADEAPRLVTRDVQRPRPPIERVVVEPPRIEMPPLPTLPPEGPLHRAVAAGKAEHAADLVVSPIVDRGVDWFHAMSICRTREFHGVDGWFLPTRPQLVALARARVLPDALLWSRNKGDRDGEDAIAVGGRSGLGRPLPKSASDVALVCVHAWPPEDR